MIIDITGIELTPGNNRINCRGNGAYTDKDGILVECCCEECDYMLCCLESHDSEECENCTDENCPNVKGI